MSSKSTPMTENSSVTDSAIEPGAAPVQPVEPKADQAPDAARVAFDKILVDRKVIAEKPGQEPKAEKAPEKAAKATEEQPVAGVDTKERERALAALRRAKAPQSVIDAQDDQSLIKWGLELAGQQAEVDRRLSAPKERADKDAALDAKAEPEATGTPAKVPTEDKTSAEMLAALTDYLDDGGTKALTGLLEHREATLRQQFEEQTTARVRDAVSPLAQVVADLVAGEQLRGLQGRFPKLTDSEMRETVRGKMLSLLGSGTYESPSEAALDACRIIFHDQTGSVDPSRNLDLNRMKDAGQGAVNGRRAGQPETSAESRSKAKFYNLLDKHGISAN